MQWADERNAGFSTARPGRLPRPVVTGRYGPMAVNVTEQRRDPDSLLNWMERLIRRRRECPEFGWGTMALLDTSDDAVLAHQCEWDGSRVLALHNFSPEPREITVRLGDVRQFDRLVDLLMSGDPEPCPESGDLDVKLEGFAHRWYRLQRRDAYTTP
jgi:glycosidase